MGERKILPKVAATENNNQIEIKNEVGQTSAHLVDLRENKQSSVEKPFFWLNAPKKSAWRQDFLKRMEKLEQPEDLKDLDKQEQKEEYISAETKKISDQEEVPQFVLKLVASNHTWAHQSWKKVETVIVGWTDKSLVRAFVLFFLVGWIVLLPVKVVTSVNNHKVFGEKVFSLEGIGNQWFELREFKGDKRFLLVFQNQKLARATGGEIYDLILLDVSGGKIKKVDNLKENFDNLDRNLKLNLTPPEPLKLIEKKWSLKTANWWPDFPTSAKKIAWFYENSGGATVDGVFGLRDWSVDDFLSLEDTSWADFWDKLSQKAENKQAQIYFSQDQWQKLTQEKGWAGEIKDFAGDYLMFINTNFVTSSSESLIKKVELKSEIQTDQSLINTLTLNLNSEIKNTTDTDDFWNYLRIYVPAGVTLISSEGFSNFNGGLAAGSENLQADEDLSKYETGVYFNSDGTKIYQESGKTVLANWIKLTTEDNQKVILKYRVPGNFSSDYKLYWQKQSGAPIFDFKGSLVGLDGTELRQYESREELKDEILSGIE